MPNRSPPSDEIHVLVVDDDARIRRMLTEYLDAQGLRVSSTASGRGMWEQLDRDRPDLVLLDLVLPGEDGLEIAGRLKAQTEIALIILTGRGDVVDRVVGLEIGADDYIAKPFHLREVLARIRSVLRRARATAAPEPEETPQPERIASFDGWTLHFERRRLFDPDGGEVGLTTGEFNLLAAFVQHPNRPLDRDTLMDLVKGRSWEAYDRSIDTQIVRLRRKIETDPKNPGMIRSVRAVGYVFIPRVTWR